MRRFSLRWAPWGPAPLGLQSEPCAVSYPGKLSVSYPRTGSLHHLILGCAFGRGRYQPGERHIQFQGLDFCYVGVLQDVVLAIFLPGPSVLFYFILFFIEPLSCSDPCSILSSGDWMIIKCCMFALHFWVCACCLVFPLVYTPGSTCPWLGWSVYLDLASQFIFFFFASMFCLHFQYSACNQNSNSASVSGSVWSALAMMSCCKSLLAVLGYVVFGLLGLEAGSGCYLQPHQGFEAENE